MFELIKKRMMSIMVGVDVAAIGAYAEGTQILTDIGVWADWAGWVYAGIIAAINAAGAAWQNHLTTGNWKTGPQ